MCLPGVAVVRAEIKEEVTFRPTRNLTTFTGPMSGLGRREGGRRVPVPWPAIIKRGKSTVGVGSDPKRCLVFRE